MEKLESLLERERDQLPLLLPVALGCGIAFWFDLAAPSLWLGFICLCGAFACLVVMRGNARRTENALFRFFLCAAIGCGLIWFRSWQVAAPVLERPVVTLFNAEIERVEPVLARDMVRLTLKTGKDQHLPPRVRVNVPLDAASDAGAAGRL